MATNVGSPGRNLFIPLAKEWRHEADFHKTHAYSTIFCKEI